MILACGALMVLAQMGDGGKEAVIFLGSLFACLAFGMALLLGRWRAKSSEGNEKRWRMGRIGTVIVGAELLLSVYLLLANAWAALRYVTH